MNVPPTAPVLVAPAQGDTVPAGESLAMVWKKSTDANADGISYELSLSTNPLFTGATPIPVSSLLGAAPFAAALGTGLLFLLPIPLLKRRRPWRILIVVCLALIAGGILSSCDNPSPNGLNLQEDESGYLADGLQPGTTYYWKVEAMDTRGGRTESEVRSFTVE